MTGMQRPVTATVQGVPEWRPPPPWGPQPRVPEPPQRIVPLVTPPPGAEGPLAELLRRRIVLIAGPLTWAAANQAAGELMLLDADSGDEVHLYLASPEGDLAAALMLADTVALVRGRVVAVARGVVAGAALAPFAAADRRVALPHAVFELREPKAPEETGTADTLAGRAELYRRQLAQLQGWLARATGLDPARVAADLHAGRLLDAGEASAYGLLDEVVGSPPPAAPPD